MYVTYTAPLQKKDIIIKYTYHSWQGGDDFTLWLQSIDLVQVGVSNHWTEMDWTHENVNKTST